MSTSDTSAQPRARTSRPLLVSAMIVALVLAVLPWADQPLVTVPGFLAALLATLLTCNAITAVLLLGRSRGGASPRLVVLAAAYLWSVVLIVASALTVPGLVTQGAIIDDPDAVWWCWITLHVVPAVFTMSALLPWASFSRRWGVSSAGRAGRSHGPAKLPADVRYAVHHRLVAHVVVPVLGFATTMLVVAIVAPSWFPTVGHLAIAPGSGASTSERLTVTAVNAAALLAAVIGRQLRGSRSQLEAWVVVALVAALAQSAIAAMVQPSYTVGYFAGCGLGLMSAFSVLWFMLHDDFALHRRTADDATRLQQQNAELREAGQLRDHLVAVVSHEMRTPLAGLQGYLELLSGDLDADPAISGRMLERSWLLTRRLTLLAEDLLAVATSQHGEFLVIPERLNLSHQLDECAACFPDLDLRIECPPDLMVDADTLRLQQVLTNLVRNAQKHGAEPVTLTGSRVGDTVVIRVADSGPGVPRDFVHRLFERYAQGASHPQSGGSGLGLAVVRDLVRAHGGTVRYDLTEPAFVVVLPQRHRAQVKTEPKTEISPVPDIATPDHPMTLPPLDYEDTAGVAIGDLLDLPPIGVVEIPDTLPELLAEMVGGGAHQHAAPMSASEAFTMLRDEGQSDPGSPT